MSVIKKVSLLFIDEKPRTTKIIQTSPFPEPLLLSKSIASILKNYSSNNKETINMKIMRQVANCNTVHPLTPVDTVTANQKNNDNDNDALGRFYGENQKYPALKSKIVCEKVMRNAKKRLKRSLSNVSRSDSSSFLTLQQHQQEQQRNVVDIVHNQIELGEVLGQGAFSSIYEIKSLRGNGTNDKDMTKERCVVKVLQLKLLAKPSMLAACAADLVKEGVIMSSLRHNNILSVKAWAPSGLAGFQTGRHDAFFLVLDRLDLTLTKKIGTWKKQTKRNKYSLINRDMKKANLLYEQSNVALQLADAIQYLHSQNILHRDLKPDNIGFDRDGVLKVFDFDVARMIPKSLSSSSSTTTCRNSDDDETFLLSKRVGSPRYMAPEVALGQKYNLKADVYSFGLLLHQILSLEKPYKGVHTVNFDYIVCIEGVRPVIPKSWSPSIQSLLSNSWSNDIKTRPKMSEIHSTLKEHTATLANHCKVFVRQ